jgi:hypothetical protein
MRTPDLRVLRVVQGLPKAQVLKSYLESYSIPVHLDYESVGRIYGITVDGLGEVRILVPRRTLRRARRLLLFLRRPPSPRRRGRRGVSGRSRRRARPTGKKRRATAARRR